MTKFLSPPPQPPSLSHYCRLPHHTSYCLGLYSHLNVVTARSPGPNAGGPIYGWYEGSPQCLPSLPGEVVWLGGLEGLWLNLELHPLNPCHFHSWPPRTTPL